MPDSPTATGSTSAGTSVPAHPEVRCLILTSYDDDEALFAAVMAGAAGYLLKQIAGNTLLDAVRAVAAGTFPDGPRRDRQAPRPAEAPGPT